MSKVSYKTLWREVSDERDRLAAEITRLKERIEHINGLIAASRNDLAESRPLVDLAGIARHMRAARYTPQQWSQRGLLPPVDFPEIKEPLWYAATVRDQFAIPTGRPWYDHPEDVPEDAPEALSPVA